MPEKAHPLRRALGGMGHSAGAGAAAGVVTSMAPLIVALVTGRALRLPSTISVTLATAGSRRRAVPLRLRALDGQPTADLGAVADGHPYGVGRGVTPSTSTCRARGPRSRPGSCPRPRRPRRRWPPRIPKERETGARPDTAKAAAFAQVMELTPGPDVWECTFAARSTNSTSSVPRATACIWWTRRPAFK